MRLHLVCSGAVLLAGFASTTVARADGDVWLEVGYHAPVGCPDERQFIDAVRMRTSRLALHPPRGGSPARTLEVRVSREANNMSGDLTLADGAGAATHRVVTATTCADVISALALVTALTIDATPETTIAAPGARAPSLAPPPPAPPPPAPPELPSAAPLAVPREGTVMPPVPMLRASIAAQTHAQPPRTPGTAHLRLGGGAGLEAIGVGALGTAFAPDLLVEAVYLRPGLLSPAIRLEFAGTIPTSLRDNGTGATAAFHWLLGRAQVCPIRARWRRVSAVPCAAFSAGAVGASPAAVSDAFTPTRPWLAADVAARVEWAASRFLSFELEGGAGAPFHRDNFVFQQPDLLLYRPPVVYPFGSFHAVVTFR